LIAGCQRRWLVAHLSALGRHFASVRCKQLAYQEIILEKGGKNETRECLGTDGFRHLNPKG